MLITIEWLREHYACYCKEDATDQQKAILARFPTEGVPLRTLLEWEDVPAGDRIWVAVQALPPETGRRWLGITVRRALGRADHRSLAVLPYLDRGEEVPGDVRFAAGAAADAARTSTVAYYAASAAANAAGSDYYEARADCVLCAYSSERTRSASEEEQQIRDLLALLPEEESSD